MSLIDLMRLSFKGPLANWVILLFIIILFEAVFLAVAVYEFFVAPDLETQVFWGFVSVFLVLMVGLQKMWYWMHIYFLWGQENKAKEEAE